MACGWHAAFETCIWSVPILSFLRSPSPMAPSHNTTSEVVRLATGKVQQPEIPRVLSTILNAPDYIDSIRELQEQDLKMWVGCLDKVRQL